MVNTAPVNFFYPQAQQDILASQRQAALAKLLMEQGNQPIEGHGAPISPYQGLAKLAQTGVGLLAQQKSDQGMRDSSTRQYNAIAAAFGQRPVQAQPQASSSAASAPAVMPVTQTPQAPPQDASQSQGLPSVTGDRKKDMMLYMLDPDQYMKAATKIYEPTDTARLARESGGNGAEYARALLNKQGTLELRPGGMAIGPMGTIYAPQNGIQMGEGTGGPIAAAVPGFANANAQISGAQKAAEQAATIFPGQTVNGRDNVAVPGSALMANPAVAPVQIPATPSPATDNTAAIGEFNKMAQDLGQPPMQPPVQPPATAPVFGKDVAVQKANEEGLSGQAKELEKSFETAKSSAQALTSVGEARNLVNAGMFNGAFADWKLEGAKVLKQAGLLPEDFQAKTSNTETFAGAMGKQILSAAKALGGSRVTNMDLEFVKEAAGGHINLEPESIKRLLNISEQVYQKQIQQHNEIYNAATQNGFRSFYPMTVTPPDASGAPTSPAGMTAAGTQLQHGQKLPGLPDANTFPQGKGIMGADGKILIPVNGKWVAQ